KTEERHTPNKKDMLPTMEEADLLKERLQAITDKRRIQEDIAKKRRQIEEEKLKLQYIKKKSLREQWLMDGLSQQSEEEQQAMRLQAQDEQQQSDQLQSNILRIEKEIEALEQKELSISFNEEIVLKRLKEVERTPEDIIKNRSGDPGMNQPPNLTSYLFSATFAIQISVEHNNRTGRNQVVSSATVNPDSIHERGLKVYDDGRTSVYVVPLMEDTVPDGALGEMSSTEVEELLHQVTDQTVPSEVQSHHPVFSVPYTVIRDSTTADETRSDFHIHPATENTVKLFNTLPEEEEEEPVTMIFIGYENAPDEEE
uniref:Palmdelphin-like n=1 Tax=Poecilia formosa TaxID=48698 RepID=A0A096MBE5_POEFO